MPTLDEFLETGRLGPLRSGLEPQQVRQALGEPDGYTARSNPFPIFRYGPVQVGFQRALDGPDTRLSWIRIDLRQPPASLPESIRLEGWVPAPGSGIAEVREHVASLGIPVPATPKSTGDSEILALPSGVHFVFADGGLDSIQFQEPRAPRYRQVSGHVAEADWPEFLRRAADAKLSASALLSLWIRERLATGEARPANGPAGSGPSQEQTEQLETEQASLPRPTRRRRIDV